MTSPFPLRPSEILIIVLAIVSGSSLLGVIDGTGLYIAAFVGAMMPATITISARKLRLLPSKTVATSLFTMLFIGGFVTSDSLVPDWPAFFGALTKG